MAIKSTTTSAPPAISSLLTRAQVIERIRIDIAKSSLTEVASKHGLSPSQLSDIVSGRANLSEKARTKLRWKLHEFYEKVG